MIIGLLAAWTVPPPVNILQVPICMVMYVYQQGHEYTYIPVQM